jgi:hypothetical protein
MKIQSLLNEEALLIESHMAQSRKMLRESCDGLTHDQRVVVEGIYNELRPLIEASLTADQIKQVFGAVEKQAVAGGGSRTLVGKGVDVTKKANEIINNVGKWLQDTTPVKMADQKFEQLKAKVGTKFPELDKQLTGLGTWMKENPGKSAAIIGVLTALASISGGPVGGAIAGQVLRGASELIKGEKLSTAVGKGIKTAALGFIAGKAFEMLGDWLGGLRADVIMRDNFADVSFDATKSMSGPGWEWTKNIRGVNIQVLPDDAETVKFLMDTIARGGSEGVQAFDKLATLAAEFRSLEYKRLLIDVGVMARGNDDLYQVIQAAKTGLQAASQGAVAAAGDAKNIGKGKQESYYVQDRPLSEGQVYLLFKKIDQQQDLVMEGPMDLLKKGAGAVGKGLSWVGKQATEKITSAKLFASWKLEGSPTDSEELAKFLQGQGVSADIVKQVYTDMKIPAPGAAPAAAGVDIETVKQMISKLPTDRKSRLLTYLLGGKKAIKQPPPAPEEDDNPNLVRGTESKIHRGQKL